MKRVDISLQHWFYSSHIRGHPEIEAHDHNYLEFAFILSGQARHVCISGSTPCKQGDLFIIPVGSWHSYSDCQQLELVNCFFSPSLLSNELSWLAQDSVLKNFFRQQIPLIGQTIPHLQLDAKDFVKAQKLLIEIHHLSLQDDSKLELLAHLLLLLAIVRDTALQSEAPSPAISTLHPSVKRAMELLNGNITHDWTLSGLANQLRINPSYLVRLFQSQLGISPMKYLNRIRADTAATLLLARDMYVSEIGQSVGWNDPKQFARLFKSHFGQSATQYRANLLSG